MKCLLGAEDFTFLNLDERFVSLVSTLYKEYGTPGRRGSCEKALCALFHRTSAFKEKLRLARCDLKQRKRVVPTKPAMSLTREMLRAATNRRAAQGENEWAIVAVLSWASLMRIS